MKAFVYLVFPNSIVSALPEGSSKVGGEPMEHGIISSVTHGVMSGTCYAYFRWYLSCSFPPSLFSLSFFNKHLGVIINTIICPKINPGYWTRTNYHSIDVFDLSIFGVVY